MTLTTHVLDIARGKPAAGIAIELYLLGDATRTMLAKAITNVDGRTDGPLATTLTAGTYELVFTVEPYFAATATTAFYTDIPIRFAFVGGGTDLHVPLLLAPWGYSTYRGS